MKLICVVLLSCFAATVWAEQVADSRRFEVVSVRTNNSVGQGGKMSALTGSQFTTTNIPLRLMIVSAYEIRDAQLVGAPDWIGSARYDIAAKFPDGDHSAADRRAMLQNLLADHFSLEVGRETREIPIYRLVMAREDRRLGPKLVPSDIDCAKWLAEGRSQIIGQSPIGPGGARPACMMVAQRNYVLGGTRSMAQLARALESFVARQVIDGTGLDGNFDIDVQWTPEPGVDPAFGGPEVVAPDASGSIFTALQEQLGLKLEAAHAPVDVLVVESVSRPTPN